MNATFLKLNNIRQNEILDAAALVFANHGYNGANIPDICTQAGISTGALYKYFNNKEAVFLAVLKRMSVLLIEEFYGKIQMNEKSLLVTLKDILDTLAYSERVQQYRQYFILYLDIGSYSLNSFAESITVTFENIGREFYHNLVTFYQKSGELRSDIDADYLAYFIDSYITLFAYSLVSRHHLVRFDSFFKAKGDVLTNEQRISIILDSIKLIIK